MRICFLAPSSSSHMAKWCGYFLGQGHEVYILSLDDGQIEGAFVHRLATKSSANGSDLQKLGYLARYREVRKVINGITPDIVNVHYATSYGILAALACEQPYILSVWGSDIYDFPNKTPLHKVMLQFSLRRASKLLSTSRAMAEEAAKYTDKPFEITPFGVDTSLFRPRQRNHGEDFVVSIVKTLSAKYGIDVLLKAVAAVLEIRPDIPLRVRIAGKGPDEQKLKALSHDLGLEERVEWLGFISQEKAAEVWADADVGVVSSLFSSESFGVAAVEAQACGTPVIVSDISGLQEATAPGKSSLVFMRGNCCDLAACIIELYDNPSMRQALGEYGRQFVVKNYSYRGCFRTIERILSEFASSYGGNHA